MENLIDAFGYVNERYVYNPTNYPAMDRLTEIEQKIFALKHGLLHLLKSYNKLPQTPANGLNLSIHETHFKWIAGPSENLSTKEIESKKAVLKTVVNILSLLNTTGATKEDLAKVPTELHYWYRPFESAVEDLVGELSSILEVADHAGNIDLSRLQCMLKRVYLDLLYWMDHPWLPDLVKQIPEVMKSAQTKN